MLAVKNAEEEIKRLKGERSAGGLEGRTAVSCEEIGEQQL
jgi:hypothetical protein